MLTTDALTKEIVLYERNKENNYKIIFGKEKSSEKFVKFYFCCHCQERKEF